MQTVAPLVALLKAASHVHYVDRHLKDDHKALMTEVLTQTGVVLIAWEHKVLPSLPTCLPEAPTVPAQWPDDRYDMVWILIDARRLVVYTVSATTARRGFGDTNLHVTGCLRDHQLSVNPRLCPGCAKNRLRTECSQLLPYGCSCTRPESGSYKLPSRKTDP
ncbi:hypothetical protein AWV79_03780 [Cupriavidus sp. UYMMa02A]|nr:hypothetical protein AWV79_03780 [Cupriavidus sp. UYMMa02A]